MILRWTKSAQQSKHNPIARITKPVVRLEYWQSIQICISSSPTQRDGYTSLGPKARRVSLNRLLRGRTLAWNGANSASRLGKSSHSIFTVEIRRKAPSHDMNAYGSRSISSAAVDKRRNMRAGSTSSRLTQISVNQQSPFRHTTGEAHLLSCFCSWQDSRAGREE